MSLQIWLPLNGSLNNNGQFNTRISATNASINNNGKIGKCYSFNGSSSYLISNSTPFGNNTKYFTYSCWFKPNNQHNGCLFSNRSQTNTTGFTIFYYTNQFLFDDGVRWQFTPSTAIPINTWSHLTFVRSPQGKFFYLNGVLKNSTSTVGNATTANASTFSIGASQNSGTTASGNCLNGYLNDIKIYDHALSMREIQENYKLLLLHYKLNNNFPLDICKYDKTIYTEPDNSQWIRIFHHNNPTNAKFTNTDNWSAGVYKDNNRWFDIYDAVKALNKYEFMLKQKTTSSATEVKYRWIQNVSPLIATYNDVKPSAVTRITTTGYTNGNNGGIYIFNSNTHMVIANATNGNWYGAIGSWTAHSGGIPGYPNTTITSGYMDLYVKISDYQNNIIYDSSGFNNNGTIHGTLTTISPTNAKYNASTYFNGSSYISAPFIPTNNDSNFSISAWFYDTNTSTSAGQNAFYGSENNYNASISLEPSRFFLYNSSGTAYVGNYTSTRNVWRHIVIVNDKITKKLKLYINGSFISDVTTNGTIYNNSILDIGGRQSTAHYIGYMSDFRIYGIALTAEQILELYNTSTSIDNNGSIYAREVIE